MRSRTSNLLIRSQMLYPIELWLRKRENISSERLKGQFVFEGIKIKNPATSSGVLDFLVLSGRPKRRGIYPHVIKENNKRQQRQGVSLLS